MIPQLKSIVCADVDLRTFNPEADTGFEFYCEVEIGPAGSDGGDVFGFYLVNSSWLESENSKFKPLRTHILSEQFNFSDFWEALSKHIESLQGDSWEETLLELRRNFNWEFEDYDDQDVLLV